MAGNEQSTCSAAEQDINSSIHCKCGLSYESDLFCTIHSEIVCDKCNREEHKDCEMESLGGKSSKFKAKRLKDTMKIAVGLKDKIEAIKDSGISRMSDFNDIKKKCKVDIKIFRQELDNILDQLEKQTLENLDILFVKQKELLEQHLSYLTSLGDNLNNDHRILQDAKTYGKQETMFLLDRRISKQLQRYETTCEKINIDIKVATFIFEPSNTLNGIRNMKDLGTIFTDEFHCHKRSDSFISDEFKGSQVEGFGNEEEEYKEMNLRKQSQVSGADYVKLMKEQLQRELERQAREAQEDVMKLQSEQVRQNKERKEKMRQDTIQQEQEHLELIQRQKQVSESKRNQKEQMHLNQLQKEQERQEEIRKRIENEREAKQSMIKEMLMSTTEQEKSRQELISQQRLRTEQSRQEQMKEQERLAHIRQVQQEELNEKQLRQKEQRQEQIQQELQKQKEIQERQQTNRQEYLRQSYDEQVKYEKQRQEQLQKERIRREKIKHEKILEQQKEEEMRREREEMIRQEKARKEALRQEQLRQEHLKIEQLQEQQRQMREEQIRQLKEDQIRQTELLRSLYQNIK